MISILCGEPYITNDRYAIMVNDIGYEFTASETLKSECNFYTKIKAFIHVHQRQENDEWFGFSSSLQREDFIKMLKITGPAIAMSLINAGHQFDDLSKLDINHLMQIKGIGLKTADTIVEYFKPKTRKSKVKND
jgi:Holliday junction resolvasome RuvABC DNA-binding subunit